MKIINTMIVKDFFEQRRKKLKAVCEETVNMQKYKRKGRKTYCNLASRKIAEMMGAITRVLFVMKTRTSGIITGTANIICKNAKKMEEAGELKLLTENEAQHFAWWGFPVLVCWKNPKRGQSGHVAIVYPTDPESEPLMICNVGWENLICQPKNPKALGNRKKTYYRLPVIL